MSRMKIEKIAPRMGFTIDLEPGVYLFNGYSATGKTFLARIFKLCKDECRVDSCSYDTKSDAPRILDRRFNDVVLLDRYDLYCEEYLKELEEFGKTGIVLIDCKQGISGVAYKRCCIGIMKNNVVSVS